MLPFLFVLFVISGLAAFVWSSDIQSTIFLVLDKGGLWLSYSTELGWIRIFEYQIRLMSGHKPRAWKRRNLTGKLTQVDFSETIGSIFKKKWKPIHIPLRSALDIGVNIDIRRLDVHARLGIEGDAAATALLCGGIATVLQALRAVGTRGRFVPGGIILIKPVFNRARLSVRMKCILAIKASHIIREVIESFSRRKRDGQSSD